MFWRNNGNLEIEALVNEEKLTGTYELNWNASNLPSGVYFYRLQVIDPKSSSGQGFVETKKLLLVCFLYRFK